MPADLPRSSQNAAPRIGVAWRPFRSSPLVFRAGMGLFYDRYPLAFLNDALQKNGTSGFEQYLFGARAAMTLLRSSGERLSEPLSGIPATTYVASQDFPSTYSRKITAGLEYGLDTNTSITIEASSVRGFHLPRVRNALAELPPQFLLEQTARSSFAGVNVTVNRKFSNDLAWLFSYQYGRTRDDSSDFDEQPANPLND